MPIRIGLVPQIRTNLPHQQTQGGVTGTPSSIAAVVLSSASVGASQQTLSPLPSFPTIQAKVLPPGKSAIHYKELCILYRHNSNIIFIKQC